MVVVFRDLRAIERYEAEWNTVHGVQPGAEELLCGCPMCRPGKRWWGRGIRVVAQSSRSLGEFRRPWIRLLYRKYVQGYRRAVPAVAARLARVDRLTLLTARAATRPLGGPHVIVKAHPNEDLSLLRQQVRAEAMAMGCPVVAVRTPGKDDGRLAERLLSIVEEVRCKLSEGRRP